MFWRRKPKDDTPLDAPGDEEDASPEDAPVTIATIPSSRKKMSSFDPSVASPRTPSRTRSLT